MFQIIMFFRKLFLLPYELVTAPFRSASSKWKDSDRSRAMLLGLPALLVSLLGLLILAIFSFVIQTNLEPWYVSQQEKTKKSYEKVAIESARQRRQTDYTPEQRKADEEKILELQNDERIYLKKLINLNPENPEYKFKLATTYAASDPGKYNSLMTSLAPDDEPVYYKAHEVKARRFLSKALQSKRPAEKTLLFERTLNQVESCLKQDEDSIAAKHIKAISLENLNRNSEAFDVYSELFIENPDFYRSLVNLNKKMGQTLKNGPIVQRAVSEYDRILRSDESDDINTWVRCWESKVRCLLIDKEFEKAVNELTTELNRQSDDARKNDLRKLLSTVYTSWAGSLADFKSLPPRDLQARLQRLKDAYKYQPTNSTTLSAITWIINNRPLVADAAREIYDPYVEQEGIPTAVLNLMGANSLLIKDYDKAINYFEEARDNTPNDPGILNNLAYAYLESEGKQNPQLALSLVEEAIGRLGTNAGRNATHLYHTRGTALLKLSRIEEAVASFEKALQDRPEEESLIELLILCYEGGIDDQAEIYREYLAELKAKASSNEGG